MNRLEEEMDFIDELKVLGKRIEKMQEHCTTEEATKNSMVLPFFQLLGYDVFNPIEFVPEYTADVGTKKGEKVDFAIFDSGVPSIFIECKWCGETLEKHDSQLFRYFGTTQGAKFAILTNGVHYRFYTDLDNPNMMDLTPFMELNMLDIKDAIVPEVKKFHKQSFNPDELVTTASELRYTNLIKKVLAKQAKEPDENFINYLLSEVYDGKRTAKVVSQFQDIVKKSFNMYINDVLNEKLKSVMSETGATAKANDDTEDDSTNEQDGATVAAKKPKIETTMEELEVYALVKVLLAETVPATRIHMKDTASYCSFVLDNKPTKWICRVRLTERSKMLFINLGSGNEDKFKLDDLNDVMNHKESLIESVKRLESK